MLRPGQKPACSSASSSSALILSWLRITWGMILYGGWLIRLMIQQFWHCSMLAYQPSSLQDHAPSANPNECIPQVFPYNKASKSKWVHHINLKTVQVNPTELTLQVSHISANEPYRGHSTDLSNQCKWTPLSLLHWSLTAVPVNPTEITALISHSSASEPTDSTDLSQ